MELSLVYVGLAGVAALIYGVVLLRHPPSATRTMMKSLSIALLGLAALIEGGPLLLTLGLWLSAVGDGLLAQENEPGFKAGMAAFAGVQVIYIFMILLAGGGLGPDFPRLAFQAAAVISAAAMVIWIWPEAGPDAPLFAGYAVLIALMTVLAFGLPALMIMAALGAALFMASDGLIAARRFKIGGLGPLARISDHLIWAAYWLGQALIAAGFLARPVAS